MKDKSKKIILYWDKKDRKWYIKNEGFVFVSIERLSLENTRWLLKTIG